MIFMLTFLLSKYFVDILQEVLDLNNFNFHNPTKLIFGRDSVKKLGEKTLQYGERALLVTGSGSIRRIGLYDKAVDSLKTAGVEIYEITGVKPNPRISLVREGVKLCHEKEI